MDRNLTVIKRDGRKEPLNLVQIHRVLNWAVEDLNSISASRFLYQQHISFYDFLRYLNNLGLKEGLSHRWLVVVKMLKDYLVNLGRKTTPVYISITYQKLLQRRLRCRSPPSCKMIIQ